MSETICPQCTASSPEQSLYCQSCSQPLVCRNCRAPLLPTARACIQCGLFIPERSERAMRVTSAPTGYSQLKVHETPELREIDFIFANEAMEYISELFPLLFGNRLLRRDQNETHHLTEQTSAHTSVSDVSSPYTNQHSNGRFSNREGRMGIRSANVRLVPLRQTQQLPADGYQTDANAVVETFSNVSPPPTKAKDVVETYSDISSPQTKAKDVVETYSDISPPQTKAKDVVETYSDVSLPPQPEPVVRKPQIAINKWQVGAVVAIGMALSVLDNTIISVALPQMQQAFHTDFDTITWVATIYFLAQAAVIPIIGYISDRIGSKLVFLSSLTVFVIGSALCALAPTKEALMVFRGIQGIGGGALMPVAIAIIYRTFPSNERGKAIALIGIPVVMTPAFGPTLGGYLSTTFNWNAIFFINLPIGIVGLLLALRVLPGHVLGLDEHTSTEGKRFDILGFILSMVGFTALVYGISEAAPKGWNDQTVLASLIISGVLLVAFIVVELFVSDPVLDMRLFKNFTFSIANLLLMTNTGIFFGSLFLIPLFFENIQGNTALTTGAFLIGQGLGTGVATAISGAFYNRIGPRILSVLGLLCLVGGTYMFTQLDVNTTGQSLQVWMVLRGLGFGFLTMPLQTLALSVVSNKTMAKASSLISIMRQVVIALGVSGLTTYLIQQTTTHATDIGNSLQNGLQTRHLTGVAATCAQAGGPTLNLAAIKACVIQHATTTALNDTFWVTLILSAACVVLALIVGRDPAVEAYKKAKARGEKVELHHGPALSE